ncbi:2-polyprenyl-6-methoxyphenol hydroxylase-like FAD-dependent oxidoreductase [Actinoplanes octamycinicus]|uniref:2-polyprenyl-6-methoxyphenol hydroxylase-like FAD-dependent oxidoreductase n=1 Tax=Actinoplanes octamycinicus TaxID=135948 RepID=A0A7W7MCR2_9ACTN|nr:FAD-dependent monooxygenase [Actinoplanes octamycinicus]MBB4745426.1 2-polyprenyl-6-methoxyphenol hydroxylase-like FAD-dependent oxidoreductase [Actinoplanes octamycinicus]GIE56269.1 FAD-dependent oxidoreductase [Actinoplanes octamycinicus]
MHTTVAIIGAGPTGLLLAGDLAGAGVDVTVFERRSGTSNLTRAFGVHARTLEILDARGLADELVTTGARVDRLRLFDRIKVDLSQLPSRFPFLLITPQFHVERLLEERAVKAGARMVRGAELTGLDQGTLRFGTETVTADWIVGADGVHSSVREAVGLPFPGRSVLTSIMLADVRLARPPADVLAVNAVGDAFAFVAPFGDGWFRIFAWDRRKQVSDREPVTLDEIREVTRRALGTDFGITEARWMSRFHSDERQAPSYRAGNVFLAGDAAHVHSPAGGQGMNTGLQDAANLSWKLAATVQGWAAAGLLDTYQSERHPVGRLVLRSSGTLIRLAMIESATGRHTRNAVGSALMSLPPVMHRAAGILSGVGIGYPDAPRTPDTPLRDGGRLYESLRAGRFVLLTEEQTRFGYDHRLLVATPQTPSRREATLVRPDGYTAWHGPVAQTEAALRRHLGPA